MGKISANELPIALIHLQVTYGQAKKNRERMLELNRQAAEEGARIIVNTEMAVTGFSFDSRLEIQGFIDNECGPTLNGLGQIARDHGLYIAVGLPEKDPATGIFYNSAFLLGPEGLVVCRRRKITAESKWACPGPVRQKDFVDTPWGRIGLMICSETYHGLLPRTMALKGVDLVLCPANWPSGNVETRDLWRARAAENGLFLAVCNRAGADRRMDCSESYSCFFGPNGESLMVETSRDSRIFSSVIPLNQGRIDTSVRDRQLSTRTPWRYHYLYADVRLSHDLTELYYDIPRPGPLSVHALSLDPSGGLDFEDLLFRIKALAGDRPGVAVLPRLTGGEASPEFLGGLARRSGLAVSAELERPDGSSLLVFSAPTWHKAFAESGPGKVHEPDGPFIVDYETARLGLASFSAFSHPELAVAMAKRGCDLALISGNSEKKPKILAGVKCLEKLRVAAAFPDSAHLWEPPTGHQHWREHRVSAGLTLSRDFDSTDGRSRIFLDRVDFDLLLQTNHGKWS